MIFLAPLATDIPVRTPAIYRCPAAEAESKFFPGIVEDDGFDAFCVEPRPGPQARRLLRGLRLFSARSIDTRANVRWRDATVALANGRISPKAWVERTRGLGETVHFLSHPKAPSLREATGQVTARAVFAQQLVLAWPGRPCFTADDTGVSRYLPGPGRLESWLLAMRDYLGPMLYLRHDNPAMVVGRPTILRADPKPGLLVFSVASKPRLTFYFNNAPEPVKLPKIDLDKVTISRGLNVDEPTARLMPAGSFIVSG